MTIPVAVLGAIKLAVTAVSAGVGVAGAVSAKKRAEQQYEDNKQASQDAYILKTHLANKKLSEQAKATSQKKQDNSIKRLQAEGSALTSAAAGGVEGLSVDQVLDDFKRSEGITEDRIDASFEARESQVQYELKGYQLESSARVNSIPVPDNSGIYSAAIRGTGAVVGGLSDYKDLFDGDYDV